MTELTAGEPSLAMGDILNRTVALLGANAIRVVPALLGMIAFGVVLDLGWARSEFEVLAGILSLLLQYWLTASLLKDLQLHSASRPRFIAFFLLVLATSIGIGLGFVFLIIPGILFIVRWSIASPALVASDARVFEAIEYSWRATGPHAWRILGAMLVIYAPAVVVGIVIMSQGEPGTRARRDYHGAGAQRLLRRRMALVDRRLCRIAEIDSLFRSVRLTRKRGGLDVPASPSPPYARTRKEARRP